MVFYTRKNIRKSRIRHLKNESKVNMADFSSSLLSIRLYNKNIEKYRTIPYLIMCLLKFYRGRGVEKDGGLRRHFCEMTVIF